MSHYTGNPDAIAALVRDNEVHRDVYTSPEVFALEMRHLWRSSWIYVGHDSQVPDAGDYVTTQVGLEPVVMIRDRDGEVKVLLNRCAHKGAKVVTEPSGHVQSILRCPYHGWSFHFDGSLRLIPLQNGYENTGFDSACAAGGMVRVRHVAVYRGFVFVRLSDTGPEFHDYFGDSLSSIDNMADRSPEGRLEIAGGVLRYMHDCNWKMFIENLNDTMHPMVAHHSSAGTARDLWYSQQHPEGTKKPMVVEQFEPFVSNYEFFDNMGVRIYPNGHSFTGVHFSIHSAYSEVPGYHEALRAAYGEEKTAQILATNRHNTVYYPSLTIKGAIQAIRVARPIAVNRTVIESWTFRLAGTSDELLKRTLMYSRLINAPTSVVGHDDLTCYRGIQEGLAASGNDWVSLHRGFDPAREQHIAGDYNGTNEVSMRGQFRAWRDRMVESMQAEAHT
ncbi:MAG: Rieske 2Fe-2S domain-containing protein [Pseudomonadales bacterium]|nr:Rieske 2Fe-2S domain-containing protein [Pseudomonadales bacterium]